jgi:hypothetical protein
LAETQAMIEQHYLEDTLLQLRKLKDLADKAIAQIEGEQVFAVLDPEANSIAVIMKHVAGNLTSRWTDFLTTDGEKPDRQRDTEFEIGAATTRAEVLRWWEEGWACTFAALEPLTPGDLLRDVFIRGERHTVLRAINRQLSHYAYHIGQIVLLARHFRSADWRSLSIPKKRS